MELQWPLILFTSILAWSVGLFGAQAIYALRGEGAKAQMPALITSVVLMAISGIAVFFHLQHWERIFNGFGHITSGITQELIAIIVVFIVMVIYFVYLRRSGEGKVPTWVAVIAIVTSAILMCVAGHSYMMPARPAWDSVIQIASLLGAACAMGPATMAVIVELKDGATDYSGKINVIGQIIGAALTIAFVAYMTVAVSATTQVPYWFDPVSPTRDVTTAIALSPFAGEALGVTIASIVAAIVGVVASFMGKKQGNWKVWGTVATVAALAAAMCLRVLLYMMGVSVYPFF